MKYGEQLEQESVPQWSLHNLDYNSLKHEIKVHTTRDQASAIAIPGHRDPALAKFEDRLYHELCRQHDRVDLFVSSKADEIARRLAALSASIERWAAKCPTQQPPELHLAPDGGGNALFKRQRRYARYERELLRCGDDVHALSRFATAQTVAFRKIIKKYRKWTSSAALGSRFTDNVLANPQSFTRRDYSHLRASYDATCAALRAAAPQISEPSSPSSDDMTIIGVGRGGGASGSGSRPGTSEHQLPEPAVPHDQPVPRSGWQGRVSQITYWNEYDDGSEGGDPEDEYAIYVNPDDEFAFPGLAYVQAVLSMPFEKAKQWFRLTPASDSSAGARERDPLLCRRQPEMGYASTTTAMDSEEEEGYASSGDFPAYGYAAHYALPSVGEQRMRRYREKVLFWATFGCFIMSFILLAISSALVLTGRHKLRVEVDAVVSVGIMMSLLCACMALGMSIGRRDPVSLLYRVVVGSSFIASCSLNGMLLLLVLENAP